MSSSRRIFPSRSLRCYRRTSPSAAAVSALTLLALVILFAFPARVRAAAAEAIAYVRTIGTPRAYNNAPGTFTSPLGVAYDEAGRLFATDTEWFNPFFASDRLQAFDPAGQFLYVLQADDPTPLNYPIGVAVDATGKIVVADAGNDRIVVFGAATVAGAPTQLAAAGVHGNYDPLDPDSSPGDPPLSPLTLWFPTDVALKAGTRLLDPTDTAGRVAVVDDSNHRVVVLDALLTPLYAFGGMTQGPAATWGTMEYPWAAAFDASGAIYVADAENNRVQVFRETTDAQGGPQAQFVRTFGSEAFGAAPGDVSRPSGLAFDPQGRLWVADEGHQRVLRIDVRAASAGAAQRPACSDVLAGGDSPCGVATSDGLVYDAFALGARGLTGSAALFLYPQDVAVSPAGTIAVADTDNHDVQIFDPATLGLSFGAAAAQTDPDGGRAGEPLTVSVPLRNDGDLPLDVSLEVAPSLDGETTGATTATIQPRQTFAFGLQFVPHAAGPLSFALSATGRADVLAGGAVAADPLTIDAGAVAPQSRLFVSAAGPSTAGAGDRYELMVTFVNPGDSPLDGVQATVTPDNPALVEAAGPQPAPFALAALATQTVTYPFTLRHPGVVTFTVNGSGASPSCPAGDASPRDPRDPWPCLATATLQVTIASDVHPPSTTSLLSPAAPNAAHWFHDPVAIHLAADDHGGIGVASISYAIPEENYATSVRAAAADVTIARQGHTQVRFHATDFAQSVEPDHAIDLWIDTLAPEIGDRILTPALPANGWYRGDVQVAFVAGDGAGGSGVAQVTSPVTIHGNGAGLSATGEAVDAAGNHSAPKVVSVNIDAVPPSLTCAPARAPDHQGWYNRRVTVTCRAADQPGLSGLAAVHATCASGVTASGASQASCTFARDGVFLFLGEAIDAAGNVSTSTFAIQIDTTPPVLACGTRQGALWPPNHKLVPWTTAVAVDDAASGPGGFTLARAVSADAHGRPASGDMAGWTLGTPDTSGLVRAQPSALYVLHYIAADQAGNTAACDVSLAGGRR